MSELQLRRHALESFVAASPDEMGEGDGLSIEILPELGYINLRGDPRDTEFVAAVREILRQDLPIVQNTMTIGEHRVFWLGPNEWLIVSPIEHHSALIARLRETLVTYHGSVTDVSGGQLLLRLIGPGVRDVLVKGCTLDFHPSEFALNACAQSGLAKANILISLVDEEPVFEIIVRRSFAEYVVGWLKQALIGQGVTFSTR